MRRIIAIVAGIYFLLVLFNGFVLVELFLRRVGISILFAIAAALACIGTGFLIRKLQSNIPLNFIVGYPIFGTICFLIGLLKISPWTMVPMVGMLGGLGAISFLQRTEENYSWKPFATVALVFIGVAALIAAQA